LLILLGEGGYGFLDGFDSQNTHALKVARSWGPG
jgi:hypothetical protein